MQTSCCVWNNIYVYSQHVSGTDYSHGTPFGEEVTEISDLGCVGVDYEVRNDELLKQIVLQMFPLSSRQTSSSLKHGDASRA